MNTLRLQTPTAARLFSLALLVVALLPGVARAAEPTWTAEQAVERALENPEVSASLEAALAAEIDAAHAEVDEATVRPAPELGIDHEQVFGAAQVGYLQTTVMLRQRFDLSPWRRRLRETVSHRENELQAETAQWRLEVATAVRQAFYRVRHHEERVTAIEQWIARLERGVAAMDERRERGDVSPYEVRRVTRELEIAVARRAEEQSQLAEAWAELEAWAPWDSQPRLIGELTPSELPSGDTASLPTIVQLEQRQAVLGAELDVWGRPFGRGWTLGAGYRFARQGGQNGQGFMVSLSLPLALWNTDRPRVERLRAEHRSVEAELALTQTLAERAADGSHERLRTCLAALAELPTAEHDGELSQLAETAYGAGEATLLELLDAYESEVELRLSRVDLQWEARRAAIELQRRLGIGAAS